MKLLLKILSGIFLCGASVYVVNGDKEGVMIVFSAFIACLVLLDLLESKWGVTRWKDQK